MRIHSNKTLDALSEPLRARLAHKLIGSKSFREGAAYEGAYVAYRTIMLASSESRDFTLRDDVECFVDDLVVRYGETIEYCQEKSGAVDWQEIRKDLAQQFGIDQADGHKAIYSVVISQRSNFHRTFLGPEEMPVSVMRFGGQYGEKSYKHVALAHPEFDRAMRQIGRTNDTFTLANLYRCLIGWWLTEALPLGRAVLVDNILGYEPPLDAPTDPEPIDVDPALLQLLDSFEISWSLSGSFLKVSGHGVTLHISEPVGSTGFSHRAGMLLRIDIQSGRVLIKLLMKWNQKALTERIRNDDK